MPPDSISEHSFHLLSGGAYPRTPPSGSMLMHALYFSNFIQFPQFWIWYFEMCLKNTSRMPQIQFQSIYFLKKFVCVCSMRVLGLLRALIEEQYARNLAKLSKSTLGEQEEGWAFCSYTENTTFTQLDRTHAITNPRIQRILFKGASMLGACCIVLMWLQCTSSICLCELVWFADSHMIEIAWSLTVQFVLIQQSINRGMSRTGKFVCSGLCVFYCTCSLIFLFVACDGIVIFILHLFFMVELAVLAVMVDSVLAVDMGGCVWPNWRHGLFHS